MLLHLVAALAIGGGQARHKLTDFHLRGSDGRHYNLKSLTAGKPVLIFYLRSKIKALRVNKQGLIEKWRLDGFEAPSRIADLNRLSRMTKGKLRVVGFTDESYDDVRLLVRQGGCKFLLLGEDEKYSSLELITQILVGYNNRDLCHLQNVLILPDGTKGAIWSGYCRASLKEMEQIVAKAGGPQLHLDLSRFPRRWQAGTIGMYGLPGP